MGYQVLCISLLLFNAVCGIISPAGLMITECPQLWKWSPSGQIGITAHNVWHRIPCDKIVIKVSGVRTIVKICLIFFSKVYIRSVCIVKENTVNTFFFRVIRNGMDLYSAR